MIAEIIDETFELDNTYSVPNSFFFEDDESFLTEVLEKTNFFFEDKQEPPSSSNTETNIENTKVSSENQQSEEYNNTYNYEFDEIITEALDSLGEDRNFDFIVDLVKKLLSQSMMSREWIEILIKSFRSRFNEQETKRYKEVVISLVRCANNTTAERGTRAILTCDGFNKVHDPKDENCSSPDGHLMYMSCIPVVKKLLRDKTTANWLKSYAKVPKDENQVFYTDFMQKRQKEDKLKHPDCLHLYFGLATDGVNLMGCKYREIIDSVYICYNIPPGLRHSKEFVFRPFIFPQISDINEKVDMDSFFKVIASDFNFEFSTYDATTGKDIKVMLHLVYISGDIKTLSSMKGIAQQNRTVSSQNCVISRGIFKEILMFEFSDGRLSEVEVVQQRTSDFMKLFYEGEWNENEAKNHGIVCRSIFIFNDLFPDIDPEFSFALDMMNLVLLNCLKSTIKLLMSPNKAFLTKPNKEWLQKNPSTTKEQLVMMKNLSFNLDSTSITGFFDLMDSINIAGGSATYWLGNPFDAKKYQTGSWSGVTSKEIKDFNSLFYIFHNELMAHEKPGGDGPKDGNIVFYHSLNIIYLFFNIFGSTCIERDICDFIIDGAKALLLNLEYAVTNKFTGNSYYLNFIDPPIQAIIYLAEQMKNCGPGYTFWSSPMERSCKDLKMKYKTREKIILALSNSRYRQYLISLLSKPVVKVKYGGCVLKEKNNPYPCIPKIFSNFSNEEKTIFLKNIGNGNGENHIALIAEANLFSYVLSLFKKMHPSSSSNNIAKVVPTKIAKEFNGIKPSEMILLPSNITRYSKCQIISSGIVIPVGGYVEIKKNKNKDKDKDSNNDSDSSKASSNPKQNVQSEGQQKDYDSSVSIKCNNYYKIFDMVKICWKEQGQKDTTPPKKKEEEYLLVKRVCDLKPIEHGQYMLQASMLFPESVKESLKRQNKLEQENNQTGGGGDKKVLMEKLESIKRGKITYGFYRDGRHEILDNRYELISLKRVLGPIIPIKTKDSKRTYYHNERRIVTISYGKEIREICRYSEEWLSNAYI